jgi:hypothetical protein
VRHGGDRLLQLRRHGARGGRQALMGQIAVEVPADAPLVRATVGVGKGERAQVIGRLLGRMTRLGGEAVSGEVELLAPDHGGRVTLVPVTDLSPLNDAAKAAMLDVGPTSRARKGTD